jgi:hypothetical protein
MNRKGQFFDTVFYYDDREYQSIDQLVQGEGFKLDSIVLVIRMRCERSKG